MYSQQLHTDKICFHCGSACNSSLTRYDDKLFCCSGCKAVYEILQSRQLCGYYDFKKQPGNKTKNTFEKNDLAYLDTLTVKQHLVRFEDGNNVHIVFQIPGMHCISCIWLMEHLEVLMNGIVSSRVNFQQKEVYIVFDATQTKISDIANTLYSVGYEPVINFETNLPAKSDKTSGVSLLKLGLAGFCFVNIMMLSFPEYLVGSGTVEPALAQYFKWLCLLLSLPVILYCASTFFDTAYKGLKKGILNIELPVAIALAITFLRSIFEVFWANSNGYFDSLSGIVFFMLIGRWVQNNTARNINFNRDYQSFFPIVVTVLNGNKREYKHIKKVGINDLIEIKHGEIIPCDAILLSDQALIDYSFVTGESIPVLVKQGGLIYAGGKQLQGAITLNVEKTVSQSYLTSLWSNEVFNKTKDTTDRVINNIAMYFTYAVILLAGIAGIYWYIQNDSLRMWNAITTVLIVACPCALLLSEHFTNGNILGILGVNGFYLKGKSVLPNFLAINTIIFDKTGTLTSPGTAAVTYHGAEISHDHRQAIASLLLQTGHPLSVSITGYLDIKDIQTVHHFKVIDGKGVEGWVNDTYYKAGNAAFLGLTDTGASASQVHVAIDGVYSGYYEVKQVYREKLTEFITALSKQFKLAIVSGDNNAEEENLRNIFGDEATYRFKASPADKLQIVKELQSAGNKVLYIGDGLNDAGALRESYTGIAVSENNSLFTPGCDAIADARQLTNLHRFIQFIVAGRRIIWLSFLISSVYNIAGLWFALQGILSPLVAAILMPLSSLTIIGFTYYTVLLKAKKLQLKISTI